MTGGRRRQVDLTGTPLGPRSLDAVGRLVAALGGQGLQLLCLNKVVVDDEERWLQGMATALETAGATPSSSATALETAEAAPSSVRLNWPCLELSQVRLRFSLPVCARASLRVCMRARACACARPGVCVRVCGFACA